MPIARSRRVTTALLTATLTMLAACGGSSSDDPVAAGSEPLQVGAIPDQDPQTLQRLYDLVADHLEAELGVPVEYIPVTDYAAAVSLLGTGDLDLVWFGGLTGVQARLQTPGAQVIAQRDIDAEFHSVFIAGTGTGLQPFDDVAGLSVLAGRRFTFGSESSTSGRLMPEHFLEQAGVGEDDFAGPPGFSGSHDKTIDLVQAGTYEAGVLNEQVWDARVEAGTVDVSKVQVVYRTPAYHDYHWILGPQVVEANGETFVDDVREALLGLDADDPDDAAVLELFGAERFIPAQAPDYDDIESIARRLGLVR
jgi:phosphonate transport system substrate-binding protein